MGSHLVISNKPRLHNKNSYNKNQESLDRVDSLKLAKLHKN